MSGTALSAEAGLDLAVAADPARWGPVVEPGSHLDRTGFRYLHRPLLLPEREVDAFGADLQAVVALLRELPARLFGDPASAARALGLAQARTALIGGPSRRPVPAVGRVDAYHDGAALRILEFNASSTAGGLDWAGVLPEAYLARPAFAGYAAEHGLRSVSPLRAVSTALREQWRRAHPGAPDRTLRVALVEGAGGIDRFGAPWQRLAEQLGELDFDATLCELPELTVTAEGVTLAGRPVDVVYRVFDLGQATSSTAQHERAGALRAAHEAGAVVVWTPYEAELHRHKSWLARLHDVAGSRLSEDEAALVARVVPFTVELGSAAARAHRERLLDDREDLVVKPADGFGGAGITFGWRVDDALWRRALAEGVRTRAVVQERVRPRADVVLDPSTGTYDEWDACWGLYWSPSGFAGGGARLVPRGEPLAIGRERKRMTSLFTHPTPPGRPG